MKTQSDIPLQEDRPKVCVFAVRDYQRGFEELGTGVLELVTDAYADRSEHYIEVKEEAKNQLILRSRLSREYNYEIQKDTVICWEDQTLSRQYFDLALSFETQEECNLYWRLICSKIGKNYLEVSGHEKLDMPTENNLNYIMNKIKTSFKLIAYHIINNNEFLDCLEKIYNNLRKKKDQMGVGMITRIMKAILNSFDVKVLDALLGDRHFNFFLKVQKHQLGINFPKIYQNKTKMRMLFIFPKEISEKINIVHRALFVKENILDLGKQARMENILRIIITDKYGQIISYLIHDDVLMKIGCLKVEQFIKQILQIQPQIIKQYQQRYIENQKAQASSQARKRSGSELQKTSQKLEEGIQISQKEEFNTANANSPVYQNEQNQICQQSLLDKWKLRRINSLDLNSKMQGHQQNIMKEWKIDFIIQSFSLVKQMNGERTKKNYFNQIYERGIIKVYQSLLDQNFAKSVQVFTEIAQFDPVKFLDYLRDQFRQSPSQNLHRKLAKKYCFGNQQFSTKILNFLEVIIGTLQQRKDFMDFYSGTFIVFIFDHCPKPLPLLNLIFLFATKTPQSNSLNSLILNHKVFQKISSKIGNMMTKKEYLISVKIIRSYLAQLSNLTEVQYKQMLKIREYLVSSFLLDRCLVFFKKIYKQNNILTSTMLQTLKIITKLPYGSITRHIKQNYQYWDIFSKYFGEIAKKNPPQHQSQNQELKINQLNQQQLQHQSLLQRQQQQKYLNDEKNYSNQGQMPEKEKQQQKQQQQSIKRKRQIQQMMEQIRKKVKVGQEEEVQQLKRFKLQQKLKDYTEQLIIIKQKENQAQNKQQKVDFDGFFLSFESQDQYA